MDYYDYSYDISPYAKGIEESITATDASIMAGLSAALGAFFGIVMIISVIVGILQIVAMWKLYVKAGQKGWKSIIPIYNLVILYRICGLTPWLLFLYLASWIPILGWIIILVLNIYQTHQLSKSFGKDVGYTIGLIFLPTVFYLILGLGSSTYVGPGGNKKSGEPIDVTNS